MSAAARLVAVSSLILGLGGCASLDLRAGFADVRAQVAERTGGTTVTWNNGTDLDAEAADRLRALLGRPLTAESAVEVGLLNNRDLQALYADLGVAQADLVQAGLFRNPLLEAAVLFPVSGGRPELQFGAVVSLLDFLYVPLRRRVAGARFEEAKLRVGGAVLDFAAQVRAAFYVHQADEQLVELRRSIADALAGALEVTRRRHAAGNVTDLDLARERAVAEAARLALRSAELAAAQSRERLTALMGAWGADAAWQLDGRLAELPAEPVAVDDIERVAVERSLELATARQRLTAAGQQLGVSRATALVPETELGVGAERELDGAWKVGPVIAVPIPLFDQGQARIGRAAAEVRRAQQEYWALGVRVRSAARAARERVAAARERALYHRDILLPLHERIVIEGQLQYNAMQVGIGQVLRDREQQIRAAVGYVEALRDYWLARTDVAQLARGRLPAPADLTPRPAAPGPGLIGGQEH